MWRWPLQTQILPSEMLLIFSNPVWIYQSGFQIHTKLKKMEVFLKNDNVQRLFGHHVMAVYIGLAFGVTL